MDNPPSVLLTNPANDAIVTSTITISATASDDNGVSQVDFYVDANLIASDSDVPYETSWDSTQVADGSHTVKAVSVDSAGQTATDQASITVDNVNDPPVANAGPDQSATLGNGLNFNGSGSSDPDGSIVSYGWDFGDGQSATGTTTSHTYNATSSYTVTLTVIDNGGATDTDTATVVITEVPAQPTMHISDISFSPTVRKYGSQKRCRVTATATVANATGVWITELPITPEKIFFALKKERQRREQGLPEEPRRPRLLRSIQPPPPPLRAKFRSPRAGC